jgi:hypothetical protein
MTIEDKINNRIKTLRGDLVINKKINALQDLIMNDRYKNPLGGALMMTLLISAKQTLEAIAACLPDLVDEKAMTVFNMPREELLPHLSKGVTLVCEIGGDQDGYEPIEPRDVAQLLRMTLELVNSHPELARAKYMDFSDTDLGSFLTALESTDRETWVEMHPSADLEDVV